MNQISPTFRSGLSLVLWPFLMLMVAFSFDSPFLSWWQELFQVIVAIALFLYPVCFFVGVILSRLKSEEAKQKAEFWLGLPWKIIGACFLAVLIVGLVTKVFGK